MPTILFICTANQIRSPLAEALLKEILHEEGFSTDWNVESAGTWASDGLPALPYAIKIGNELGVDLSEHRSRMVTADMLKNAKLVFAMEERHKESLKFEFNEFKDKIFLLRELIGQNQDIRDPVSNGYPAYVQIGYQIQSILIDGFDELLRLAT